MNTWQQALKRAESALGRKAPPLARTVQAVDAALRKPELRAAFYADLVKLDNGNDFDVFPADWWTQAVVETAGDDPAEREGLLELADLARAYEARSDGQPYVPHEELLKELAPGEVAA